MTLYAFGGDHRQLKDFNNPNQVPNYGLVWKSPDGGETWSTIGSLPGNVMAVTFGGGAEATTSMWAAVNFDGLYKSDDLGISWSKVNVQNFPPIGDGGTVHITGVVVDPFDQDLIHVSVGVAQGSGDLRDGIGGVWRSDDGGLSWLLIEDGVPGNYHPSEMMHIDRSPDGMSIWACDRTYTGSGKGVFRSLDRGLTWEHVLSDSAPGFVPTDLATPVRIGGWWIDISPSQPSIVYTATSAILLRTEDNGVTWYDSLNSVQPGALSRANGYTGWVGRNVAFNPYDQDMMVVQGLDSLLVGISRDGGFGWDVDQPGLPPYNGGNDIAFGPNGLTFVGLGQFSGTTDQLIYRSTDNGYTWEQLSFPAPSSAAPGSTAVHYIPSVASTLFAVVGGVLRRSDNVLGPANRVTWTDIALPSNVGYIAATSIATQFYVTTSAGVFVTRNGGSSFESTAIESGTGSSGPASRARIEADQSNVGILWAASDDNNAHGLYRYASNSGWQSFPLPDPAERWCKDVAIHPTMSNVIAAATGQDPYVDENGGTGIWLSQDGGNTWAQQNHNLPILRFNQVHFNPTGTAIFVASGGRGFFRADLNTLDDKLFLEAELMTISAGLDGVYEVGVDGAASNGKYLMAGGTSPPDFMQPSMDAPTATYTFTTSQFTDEPLYTLRVRGSGSIFVRLDHSPWVEWSPTGSAPEWTWGKLPQLGSLSIGRHTLRIRKAAGTLDLDAIEIDLDPPLATPPPTLAPTQAPVETPITPLRARFFLVDTDTNEVLVELFDGGTIVPSSVTSGRPLSSSTDGDLGVKVRSVLFDLNNGAVTKLDNGPPFSLFGERRGDFNAGQGLDTGATYSVSATYYKRTRGRKPRGTDTFVFTIE